MLRVQAAPAPDDSMPVVRHFAQRVQTRANVGAPFRIVRVRAEKARRPVASSFDVRVMESPDGLGQWMVRRSADFVAREQRHVAIQRGVFHALCRGRSAQLLESCDELRAQLVLA